ncbi:MAG: 50S ribosomal protein L21e [Candidatus Pacearchaeota archaeon]|nr:50S ribosomal protein L21e [Candidatus Pacearchaeota archaeon]
MKQRKRVRTKGKHMLSKLFQELKEGDKVALYADLSVRGKGIFPRQFHGRTGIVEAKRGRAYIVRFKNGGVYKRLIVSPAHLKKLQD